MSQKDNKSKSEKGKTKSHWEKTLKHASLTPATYSFYSNQVPVGPSQGSFPPNFSKVEQLRYGTDAHDSPAIPLRSSGGNFPPIEKREDRKVKSTQKTNLYGFPTPGSQSPTVKDVMNSDAFFVTDGLWSDILDHGEFDFIVLGSGFTALAFVERALDLNPEAKILILERGPFWLGDHFQNLPLPFQYTLGGPSETFPWTLTRKSLDTDTGFMRGSCPFLGGRSTFWSAWSPRPDERFGHMRDWPESLVKRTKDEAFWNRADNLLHITTADKLQDKVYGQLQQELYKRFDHDPKSKIPSLDRVMHAPLAVGNSASINNKFLKFSVPGPLLGVVAKQRQLIRYQKKANPLLIRTSCVAELLITEPKHLNAKTKSDVVTAIRTSQGDLPVGDAKVILAVGMFPAVNLLRNSFPDNKIIKDRVGRRITGHFLSHVTARLPIQFFPETYAKEKDLQIAAIYLDGRVDVGGGAMREYHIQITGISAPNPSQDAIDAARECPDYAAAASAEQLMGSEKHVLFVCASLGEISEINNETWCIGNRGSDPTTNSTVQVIPSKEDRILWDAMDEATFQAIELMAGKNVSDLEYWNEDSENPDQVAEWIKQKPKKVKIQGIVHEASGCHMVNPKQDPSADSSVVGTDFRPHGVSNVYVTGASIFPTSGSWNPTLTMCGFAQDLAETLTKDLGRSHQ